jgi:hypothetical protein
MIAITYILTAVLSFSVGLMLKIDSAHMQRSGSRGFQRSNGRIKLEHLVSTKKDAKSKAITELATGWFVEAHLHPLTYAVLKEEGEESLFHLEYTPPMGVAKILVVTEKTFVAFSTNI